MKLIQAKNEYLFMNELNYNHMSIIYAVIGKGEKIFS